MPPYRTITSNEEPVITIIGDASLWKEDLRIYEIKDIALCLLDNEQ